MLLRPSGSGTCVGSTAGRVRQLSCRLRSVLARAQWCGGRWANAAVKRQPALSLPLDSAAEAPGDSARAPRKEQPSRELGAAAGRPVPLLTRKQWRNKQKNKRRQKNKFKAGAGQDVGQGLGAGQDVGQGTSALPPSEPSGVLRARMEERLQSARFRYINQQLYTSSSQEAAQLFQRDPAAFAIYHRGFARQMGRWPENPVHRIIQYLRGR